MDSKGSIAHFFTTQTKSTRQVYGGAANFEMRIVTFIAAAAVLSSHYSFRRYPVSVMDQAKRQRGRTSGAEAEEVEME